MNMINFRTYKQGEHALARGGNTVTIMEAAPGIVAQILYTDEGARYNFRVSGAAPCWAPVAISQKWGGGAKAPERVFEAAIKSQRIYN